MCDKNSKSVTIGILMKVGIMQPYFFPYVGYWQLLNIVDTYVIYDDVNYIKQGYINRNSILINGEEKRLTMEVIGASSNKLINEIEVGNNRKKLLKTIDMAYRKAPYFEAVFPVIQMILESQEKNLARFLGNSLKQVSKYLDINTNIIFSSDIDKDNTLKAQDKVIDICQKLNATQYINAIGGRELYDKKKFQSKGIDLKFIQMGTIEYEQLNQDFVSFLSIIDLMMFNSKPITKKLLNRYEFL